MNVLLFLLLFPLIPAFVLLLLPDGKRRGFVVKASAAVCAAASVVLAATQVRGPTVFFDVGSATADWIVLGGDVLLSLYLLYMSLRKGRLLAAALVLVQAGIIGYCEFGGAKPEVTRALYVDNLSLIMALIIGIIGGLIAIYSLSYMRDYHHHQPEVADRTRRFFFVLFGFLSAMFGIVFSNNLLWLFLCWEITTACSFWLIGYARTPEAVKNAFRALTLNLIGGVGFAAAILWLQHYHQTVELDKLIGLGQAAALIPAILITFAGLAKAAQMPFSSWLLGAMVAPTPVSALLHSSTMVKAGVFVVIKMAPILKDSKAGFLVALIGGITFLLASAIAVSQNNAKRVLAYSTIANLGLIVACAAVGSVETIWAAILLVIFHAVAKSLLFLTVGTIEHQLGSRDIEDMHGLITRLPALAIFMLVGIAGMFLAPFGMLLSKWVTLKAFIDCHPVLAVILAFGSAPTLFYWAKWMGKLVAVPHTQVEDPVAVDSDEWTVLGTLAVLTIGACGLFPLAASVFIEPYTMNLFQHSFHLSQTNIIIMAVMLGALLLLPFGFFYFPKDLNYTGAYLSGANTSLGASTFTGSLGRKREMVMANVYFRSYFDERRLTQLGVTVTLTLLAVLFFILQK